MSTKIPKLMGQQLENCVGQLMWDSYGYQGCIFIFSNALYETCSFESKKMAKRPTDRPFCHKVQ